MFKYKYDIYYMVKNMEQKKEIKIKGHRFAPEKARRHYHLSLRTFSEEKLEGDAYLSKNGYWYVKVPERYNSSWYWEILGMGKNGARELLREYFDYLPSKYEDREEIEKTFHVRGPREKVPYLRVKVGKKIRLYRI
jgi:hypothetical protein